MPATATGRSARQVAATLGGNTQYLSGPTANPVNAWTYVALTYDGTTVRLYINGTQVASRAATGAIQTTNSPLWIGGNSPYGEYFQGADRRGPGLQPGAHPGRDPERHERPGSTWLLIAASGEQGAAALAAAGVRPRRPHVRLAEERRHTGDQERGASAHAFHRPERQGQHVRRPRLLGPGLRSATSPAMATST